MAIKINHIVPLLLVRDLEKSIAFYVQQLDFTLVFIYEDFYAGIENGGHSIHLKIGNYAGDEKVTEKQNYELAMLFSVDDIAGLFEIISAKEVTIIQPLREMPYGKEFYIADPDGNVIAFMS